MQILFYGHNQEKKKAQQNNNNVEICWSGGGCTVCFA